MQRNIILATNINILYNARKSVNNIRNIRKMKIVMVYFDTPMRSEPEVTHEEIIGSRI